MTNRSENVRAMNEFSDLYEANGASEFVELLAYAETPLEVANAISVSALAVATLMRKQANSVHEGIVPLIAPDDGLMGSLSHAAERTAYRAIVAMSNGDVRDGFQMIHALVPKAASDEDVYALSGAMWFIIRLGEAVQSGMMETEVTILEAMPEDFSPEDFIG